MRYNEIMNNETNEKIKAIQTKMLSEKTIEKLASFYSIFADPTRLSIVCLLSEQELCVNDIAEIMDMSQSRISHQLAVLRQHDIVSYYRNGKQVLYVLSDNHIKDIFNMGIEHISEKDEEVYKDRKKNRI